MSCCSAFWEQTGEGLTGKFCLSESGLTDALKNCNREKEDNNQIFN